ncbi:MAG TPA: hypothetical protein VF041_06345 [Gemmatimonadaceae bacterium]
MTPRFAILVGALAFAASAARAEGARGRMEDGLCTPPESVDAKWHPAEAEGVSFRIPKGYTISQSGADFRVYSAGQRHIGIEWGRGPGEIESGGELNPISECRTTIDGRIVTISLFHWTRIDQAMAPSGDAGTKYLLVARFPAVQGSHAVSLWVFTPYRGDAMQFRRVFWTVEFPAATPGASVAPAAGSPSSTGAGATAASVAVVQATPVAATSDRSSTESTPAAAGASLATVTPHSASATASSMPLPPPTCGAPPAGTPAPGDVVDTTLVQMLANGSDPFPQGHGVVALTLDASGALAGVAVVDSDLPADAERQLATIVSSNIKPRPATSTTLYLRVDTGGKALRYTMVRCGN